MRAGVDNLYLDMNGIIHNCARPVDDRGNPIPGKIEEHDIFIGVITYVDALFSVIRPQKYFFLAVDGVAPRAKMNQQRSRRFRSAQEAAERTREAIRKGELAEGESFFDSNAITPGTDFMYRLSKYLTYFIARKIRDDPAWGKVRVVFSGPEVPGEGEHKIMSFIRQMRTEPDYDPNTRHCLYGLDADLIMLGLVTHEPHFALLREEVVFGKKKGGNSGGGNKAQNFFLLHISLLREYIALEFAAIKDTLSFDYDIERIIDDFVVLCFFVGNDFLPNLPSMYIPNGSLAVIFAVYKQKLGELGGYLHENGHLNVPRLQRFLSELAENERTLFDAEGGNTRVSRGKKHVGPKDPVESEQARLQKQTEGPRSITAAQRVIFEQIRDFFVEFIRDATPGEEDLDNPPSVSFPPSLSSKDRQFVSKLAQRLALDWTVSGTGKDQYIVVYPDYVENPHMLIDGAVFDAVLAQYNNAKIRNDEYQEVEQEHRELYDASFAMWKEQFYREKMKITPEMKAELNAICCEYIRGVQWVLLYYYEGVPSWSWYFPSHYAPMMSDVVAATDVDLVFDKNTPLKPFEQLMGVLPPRSLKLIPPVYHDLMTDPASPVIDFYPPDFEHDMNGKQNAWEAVVLIPFIDEKRLLSAMAPRNGQLNKVQRDQNTLGNDWELFHDADCDATIPSPDPELFPHLANSHCVMRRFDLPDANPYRFGILPGARLGVFSLPGYPSLATLEFTAVLRVHGVQMFGSDSKNESMILMIEPREGNLEDIIRSTLAKKRCYIGWPFLVEGLASHVENNLFRYTLETDASGKERLHTEPLSDYELNTWEDRSSLLAASYSKRGILVSDIDSIVYIRPFKGMRRLPDGSLEPEYASADTPCIPVASSMVVTSVREEDPRYIARGPLPTNIEMPVGSSVVFLTQQTKVSHGQPFPYGSLGVVRSHGAPMTANVQPLQRAPRPMLPVEVSQQIDHSTLKYIPGHVVARTLGIHPLLLARITGRLQVQTDGNAGSTIDIGLRLKFAKGQIKVDGYTRCNPATGQWEYSALALDLLQQYLAVVPGFLDALRRSDPKQDIYYDTDLLGGRAQAAALRDWLKQKLATLRAVDVNHESYSDEQMRLVEKAIPLMRAQADPKQQNLADGALDAKI